MSPHRHLVYMKKVLYDITTYNTQTLRSEVPACRYCLQGVSTIGLVVAAICKDRTTELVDASIFTGTLVGSWESVVFAAKSG